METQLDTAYRVSGPVVNLAAALVANAVAIFTPSTFAGQIGTKTFIPKKLRVRNNNGGNGWLSLGTGVGGAFAAAMPAVYLLNNIDSVWQEVELPRVQFFTPMTAWVDVLAGGGSLDIQIEVEEQG